jgi:hypothetical protein
MIKQREINKRNMDLMMDMLKIERERGLWDWIW